LEGIQEDFKHRFGASMSSLATLEAKKDELQGAHHEKETLQDLVNKDREVLNQLGVQVEGALSKLGVEGVNVEDIDVDDAVAAVMGETFFKNRWTFGAERYDVLAPYPGVTEDEYDEWGDNLARKDLEMPGYEGKMPLLLPPAMTCRSSRWVVPSLVGEY